MDAAVEFFAHEASGGAGRLGQELWGHSTQLPNIRAPRRPSPSPPAPHASNGNWFVRRLKPLAGRALLMHGHRHVDWIGRCEGLLIVSAPSPVMEATDDQSTCFYVHTLAIGSDRRLRLLAPERIVLGGSPSGGRKEG
ncbi:hypothetical protein MesoLjLc_75100 [Mesorhizobium sp. L-8-10]|nr:hypothetical protein MesoLjLc_75100 [Mesorhizobium sp. L-8-10]